MGESGSRRGGTAPARAGLTAADLLELYDRCARELTGYFARRTGDPEVAVELVAETFTIAFADRERCRAGDWERRRGWLYGIAMNQLAMRARSRERERRAIERAGGRMLRALSEFEYERIEQLAAESQLHMHLEGAMARLPEEQQRALRGRVVAERSYTEVAEDLGITEQAARQRVSRGLLQLRRLLTPMREVAR